MRWLWCVLLLGGACGSTRSQSVVRAAMLPLSAPVLGPSSWASGGEVGMQVDARPLDVDPNDRVNAASTAGLYLPRAQVGLNSHAPVAKGLAFGARVQLTPGLGLAPARSDLPPMDEGSLTLGTSLDLYGHVGLSGAVGVDVSGEASVALVPWTVASAAGFAAPVTRLHQGTDLVVGGSLAVMPTWETSFGVLFGGVHLGTYVANERAGVTADFDRSSLETRLGAASLGGGLRFARGDGFGGGLQVWWPVVNPVLRAPPVVSVSLGWHIERPAREPRRLEDQAPEFADVLGPAPSVLLPSATAPARSAARLDDARLSRPPLVEASSDEAQAMGPSPPTPPHELRRPLRRLRPGDDAPRRSPVSPPER